MTAPEITWLLLIPSLCNVKYYVIITLQQLNIAKQVPIKLTPAVAPNKECHHSRLTESCARLTHYKSAISHGYQPDSELHSKGTIRSLYPRPMPRRDTACWGILGELLFIPLKNFNVLAKRLACLIIPVIHYSFVPKFESVCTNNRLFLLKSFFFRLTTND